MPERHPDDAWQLALPMTVSARMHRILLALADAILPESPRTESTLDDVTRLASSYWACGFSTGRRSGGFEVFGPSRCYRPLLLAGIC